MNSVTYSGHFSRCGHSFLLRYAMYRSSNPNKLLIAKKVREGSNELEIFDILNSIQLKSMHIVRWSIHSARSPGPGLGSFYPKCPPSWITSRLLHHNFLTRSTRSARALSRALRTFTNTVSPTGTSNPKTF